MLPIARRFTLRACVPRKFDVVNRCSSASSPHQRFNTAVANVKKLPEELSNDVKKKLYALYKQATVGKCNATKPGVFDLIARAKWDAWNSLGDMTKAMAQEEYASLVEKLADVSPSPRSGSPNVSSSAQPLPSASDSELTCNIEDNAFIIRFNRPNKKNSITLDMLDAMVGHLTEAATRKDVHYVVLTGAGDFFSSGNDLNNLINRLKTGLPAEVLVRDAVVLVRKYVAAFIDFPKPAVALVNGPSIGVSCTVLGLFDLVYASDKAYFHTPFTQLGMSPECCSSYLFPRVMGVTRANRLLMLNEKLSASEAKACGFVTDVFPHAAFQEETKSRLQQLSKLQPKSLQYMKTLIRDPIRADLHKANDKECDRLEERILSEEAVASVLKFFKEKGTL